MAAVEESRCCRARLAPMLETAALRVERCCRCGTAWAEHSWETSASPAWAGAANVTEEFLEALRSRRAMQAVALLRRFGDALRAGPVLDYGCGQGELTAYLLKNGIDCHGCDIDVSQVRGVPPERILRIPHPEQLPGLDGVVTLVSCDVIEHMRTPREFLARTGDAGIRKVLLKTPLLNGPLAAAALLAARLGRPTLLERMFQVGDPFPHHSFFTPAGLHAVAASAGYRLLGSVLVPEVGAELPTRVRGNRANLPRDLVLGTVGAGLALVARLWSDTGFFLYERA